MNRRKPPRAVAAEARRLLPAPIRRAAARLVASRREAEAGTTLAQLAADRGRPIVVGPFLGEVGFELLYWVPFLRWFAERYEVGPDRLIAVSRGGAATWYLPFAARAHDAFDFMDPDLFRKKNEARIGKLGEQKQIAVTSLDDEILAFVKREEGEGVGVLHPSTMYRLFAPYWWGHQPLDWVTRHARYTRLQRPPLAMELPPRFTAVKFYFNDCFGSTPENQAFVERTIRELSRDGPVISLSSGVAVDDHAPCEAEAGRDDAWSRSSSATPGGLENLLTPQTNLLVQSAIVARAQRFVGTYGGFAYLAPFYGVPSLGYYSEPAGFAIRHLDLARRVLAGDGLGRLETKDRRVGVA